MFRKSPESLPFVHLLFEFVFENTPALSDYAAPSLHFHQKSSSSLAFHSHAEISGPAYVHCTYKLLGVHCVCVFSTFIVCTLRARRKDYVQQD
jgi:hypothetical protein